MRALLLVALVATASLAGCASTGPTSTTQTTGPAPNAAASPPKDITDSKTVAGSADPANVGTNLASTPCANPPSACIRYPFKVDDAMGTVTYEATLTWGLGGNDFDLYLFKDGKQAAASANGAVNSPLGGGNPPATAREHLKGSLEPGSYEIVIDPFSVAQDTYALKVTFATATT
jgi:hypothetical protein